ncbi:MAG: hypothetical protein SGILL_005995 [Bacillariaceae sp.]
MGNAALHPHAVPQTPSQASSTATSSPTALSMKPYKPPVQNSVRTLKRGTASGSASQRKASVATTLHAPSTTSSSTSSTAPRSFEDRMRNVMGRQDNVAEKSRTSTRTLPANLHYCHTLEEYKSLVADETERLVVVGFFAAEWCKACQAAIPWFHRSAEKYPSIKFVHVPVTTANLNLHQGLGVSRLPSGHVYHPTEGLVQEDIRFTKKCLAGANSEVSRLLQWYVQGSCDLLGVGDCRNPMEVPQQQAIEKRP